MNYRVRRPTAPTFTIEFGNGETYRNARPTVYKHDVYPRGSVLAGRPRRTWVNDFATVAEAKAAHPTSETRATSVRGARRRNEKSSAIAKAT